MRACSVMAPTFLGMPISEKLVDFTGADIEFLTDRAALLAFRGSKSPGKRVFITPELILAIAKNRLRSVTQVLLRKSYVTPVCLSASFQPFRGPRPRALATVHATSSISRRRRPVGLILGLLSFKAPAWVSLLSIYPTATRARRAKATGAGRVAGLLGG